MTEGAAGGTSPRDSRPAPPGLAPAAIVREGFEPPRGKALLFDVDGVLLDVRGSFRRVVCEAANRYLAEAGLRVWESPAFRPEDVRLFKDASGFNHDGSVARGAAAFFLWKAKALGDVEGQKLRLEAPTLAETLARVKEAGGGLDGLARVLGPQAPSVDGAKLDRWCEMLYAGAEHCRALYGYDAEPWVGRGAVEDEYPLIGRRGRSLLRDRPVGVVTGRTPAEAEMGLRSAGLRDLVRALASHDGSCPRKPDPSGIAAALESLGETGGFYFGDTLDDLRTVRNWNRLGRGALAAVLCASGEGSGEPSAAIAEGWDVVVPVVDEGIAFALGLLHPAA